ncbi:hypothetical protein FQA47_015875 [Oryzias melastigma]|uniref:Uncharacterized protein n=1 Tax=Oryzias melastigma TaxID=30732 RepID=A0A834FBA6_ORYME|nr:hypothetical protein FQA47_015875 [Oryzias melastigma]
MSPQTKTRSFSIFLFRHERDNSKRCSQAPFSLCEMNPDGCNVRFFMTYCCCTPKAGDNSSTFPISESAFFPFVYCTCPQGYISIFDQNKQQAKTKNMSK